MNVAFGAESVFRFSDRCRCIPWDTRRSSQVKSSYSKTTARVAHGDFRRTRHRELGTKCGMLPLPRKRPNRKRRGPHSYRALSGSFCRNVGEAGRYCDGNGLYLHVESSGSRRWVQRLVIRGKSCTLGLGSYRLVSLADARELALANRKVARSGGDPLAERRCASTGFMAGRTQESWPQETRIRRRRSNRRTRIPAGSREGTRNPAESWTRNAPPLTAGA